MVFAPETGSTLPALAALRAARSDNLIAFGLFSGASVFLPAWTRLDWGTALNRMDWCPCRPFTGHHAALLEFVSTCIPIRRVAIQEHTRDFCFGPTSASVPPGDIVGPPQAQIRPIMAASRKLQNHPPGGPPDGCLPTKPLLIADLTPR